MSEKNVNKQLKNILGKTNLEVEPSTAFWGIPPSTTELCIGALPAATLRTEKKIIFFKKCYFLISLQDSDDVQYSRSQIYG